MTAEKKSKYAPSGKRWWRSSLYVDYLVVMDNNGESSGRDYVSQFTGFSNKSLQTSQSQ